VQTFDMEKSFAYRSCIILRAYQEHLFPWLPLRNVEAHVNLTPTLLAKFKGYLIFSRDLDSAFGYDATRSHQDTFRAPYTTNEQRMDEVQAIETGWLKRIAIDPMQCVDSVGVPIAAKEVPWIFDTFPRQAVRMHVAGGESGGATLSNPILAMNELSKDDFDSVLKGGNHRFMVVNSGFVPNDSYTKVFEDLREHASNAPALASALFAESEMEGDFIEPHDMVTEANLPKISVGTLMYVFAIHKNKYEYARGPQVLETLCKMLGYDENDSNVTVDSIMADIKAKADFSDSILLPNLARLESAANDYDGDVDDAAMMAAADAAEKQQQTAMAAE